MPQRKEEFLKRLHETFKIEAREHLDAISARLAEIAGADAVACTRAIEISFREAHTLKAAARAVGQSEIELLCQALESVFAALKRAQVVPGGDQIAVMLRAVDAASDLLAALDRGLDAAQRASAEELAAALGALAGAAATRAHVRAPAADSTVEAQDRGQNEAATKAVPATVVAPGTIRMSVQRLDALLLQTEEMLSVKLAARRQDALLREAANEFASWRSEWQRTRARLAPARATQSSGADSAADDPAHGLQTLMSWNEDRLGSFATTLAVTGRQAATAAREVAFKVDRLLQELKQILLLECRALLESVPKVVRDLAREQGKEVDVFVAGAELEIDRRVLDELKEPLLHLLRNCIDHGIETPRNRAAAGKPERATVRITAAALASDKVEFIVADDGAGIALAALAAAAVKLGLLPAERASAAGPAELLPLVFQSGVSTSPMVTDLSGRGLGLAIVRERVERLGGAIAVETSAGKGTTFRLVVPLTLATFRGVLVRVCDQVLVLPTLAVERVFGGTRDQLRTVEGRSVLALNGDHLPLVQLADALELEQTGAAPAGNTGNGGKFVAVILGSSAMRVAFEVDEILGDQEVLVKPLGRNLARVRNVLGATVLGDGRIAPILNPHDLLKSAASSAGKAHAATAHAAAAAQPARVLVVEDSITARGLLKNILETAGYLVTTAVDGVAAWSLLRLESFDVVVSDVEMPRMNGFDLTARVRADPRMAQLPVILVTALESREDRERGVDVGANAYIVKRDFDQHRLLEVLQRFV